ncbi:hypothetical protein WN66_02609 [Saccharomyces cerevisiae]|uniref:Putative uncharacterized protein YGR176W n=1 Tax=Saccharomyces cerevisiae (strain ATCC 204508 / S288c) TaxID=559292 RepID=YG3Z_YEAST|nr:RecName: Full=Putative uncharacterized protein YGR176W [Saccharomyces cerevisiae S288C]AAT93332.1 YGR176W [Saccharomyces cerevisiae]KZV11409.1 hypothetical protein WN66_02609 [Saccharomyces cerevisiae]CAA97202.1 unnamed protein product [Saccharomyces cerevisiae]
MHRLRAYCVISALSDTLLAFCTSSAELYEGPLRQYRIKATQIRRWFGRRACRTIPIRHDPVECPEPRSCPCSYHSRLWSKRLGRTQISRRLQTARRLNPERSTAWSYLARQVLYY